MLGRHQTKATVPQTKTGKSKKNDTTKEERAAYLPDIPEPTSRAELMTFWMDLSLDTKTANKMLWISDGGSKVCRRTKEVCPVLDGPERYEYSPQVLCKESIWNSRAYWEVEFSGWVVVGVAYKEAARRAYCEPSGLGENQQSWGLCWSGSCYQIWFDGVHKDICSVPFSSTIGVYVDRPAGVINFYTVPRVGSEKEVHLLHKVQTTMEKRVLPGFWLGMESSCTLLKRTELNQ